MGRAGGGSTNRRIRYGCRTPLIEYLYEGRGRGGGVGGRRSGARGALEGRWRDLSDDQLLDLGSAWEALGRVVDGRRIGFAAEVEDRGSRPGQGLRLPARYGLRDGTDLVAQVTRTSRREAAHRVNLGAEVADRSSLTGEVLPGRHPLLAAAVQAGEVGTASAAVITALFRSVRRRALPEEIRWAEAALVEHAKSFETEAVREMAWKLVDRLDPDGTGDREQKARRQRAFGLGRVDEFGGSALFGYAPAEERAVIAAALTDWRRNLAMSRRPAGHEDNDGPGPEWHEVDGERRTVRQIDFDTFSSLFTAGVRASAAEDGSAATVKAVPEVIVTTTLTDLESRIGTGVVTATGARVSVASVQRLTCGGDVRLLVDGKPGEPLWLGRPTRYFSPAQRRTLIADSGGCQWPGCGAPPAWCDVHHIAWFRRDTGPTDVENGVLLCSFHHHLIHDPVTRWRIVVHEKRPHLVPRTWSGPPDPTHRMGRRHDPVREGPPDDDPWTRPTRS